MREYILFDEIIEKNDTHSYITSARELLSELNIKTKKVFGLRSDIGTEGKSLNSEAFHFHNAYNLAIAKKEGKDIIIPEQCSYNSFAQTKEALINDEDLKARITTKLEKVGLTLVLDVNTFSIEEILRDKIGFNKLQEMVKSPFENFNVAIYYGNKSLESDLTDSILTICGANIVDIATKYDSDGYEVLSASSEIAYKLSGKILLDAFDNAADFVLSNDARSFYIFDKKQKCIEKSIGRDIELSILSISQIVLMALGCKDKSRLEFVSHKVKPTLI